MTNDEAREILQALLDGVNPETGEILPEDHCCNAPAVLRALHKAVMALTPEEPYVNKSGRLNAGRPWTEADMAALSALYRSGTPMEDICSQLHRRTRGVVKQLVYLGLVPQEKTSNGKSRHARAGLSWTLAEEQLLDQLLREQRSMEDISEQMGRSPYAIFCHMEKRWPDVFLSTAPYGQDNTPPWQPQDTDKLRQLFESGVTIPEIAAYFHRTENSISARLFYLGLLKSLPLAWPAKPSESQA